MYSISSDIPFNAYLDILKSTSICFDYILILFNISSYLIFISYLRREKSSAGPTSSILCHSEALIATPDSMHIKYTPRLSSGYTNVTKSRSQMSVKLRPVQPAVYELHGARGGD